MIILIAQTPAVDLSAISNHWKSGQAHFPVEWVLITAGLLMLVMAGASLGTWWKKRLLRPAPLGVFNHVAATCDLPWRERLLLWRIARQQALPSPLTLMLCPATLHHHAQGYLQGHGGKNQERRRAQLAALQRHLFGTQPPVD